MSMRFSLSFASILHRAMGDWISHRITCLSGDIDIVMFGAKPHVFFNSSRPNARVTGSLLRGGASAYDNAAGTSGGVRESESALCLQMALVGATRDVGSIARQDHITDPAFFGSSSAIPTAAVISQYARPEDKRSKTCPPKIDGHQSP